MPQRPSIRYKIYQNGVEDTQFFEPLTMMESFGAERLDIARLYFKQGVLEDFNPALFIGKQIEIVRAQDNQVVHWGKIAIVQPFLSDTAGEVITVVSRADRFLLGEKISGYWVWNPDRKVVNQQGEEEESPGPVHIGRELVFNPLIDGKIEGNLNDTRTSAQNAQGQEVGHPLFLDPESARTEAAQEYQGAKTKLWPLSKAVHYLMAALNKDEKHVKNRTLEELEAVFDDAKDLVKNFSMRYDTYLADALDQLLVPLGYNWFIERAAYDPNLVPVDKQVRKFQFIKRGTGGELVDVYHQRRGAVLTSPRLIDVQNVMASGVAFDATRLANHVIVRGGLAEFEVTVELARSWPELLDEMIDARYAEMLSKRHPDFEQFENIYRKWVLNEAGDYIGVRAELDGLYTQDFREAIDEMQPLGHPNEFLEDFFVARRRKLQPTLTLNDEGKPIGKVSGVEVEYSNPDFDSAYPEKGPRWLPIGNWNCRILEHEAGVYFDRETIPQEFIAQGEDLKIRATFTIEADLRLTGEAPHINTPQPDRVPLVLDLPKEFRFRQLVTLDWSPSQQMLITSKYDGAGLPNLAVDDTDKIQEFAEYVQDIWNLMDVGGPIQLEGLDHAYILGQRVRRIWDKNVSFELGPGMFSQGSERYPQIVAIERDVEQQVMTLHLERYTEPLNLFGNQRDQRIRPR